MDDTAFGNIDLNMKNKGSYYHSKSIENVKSQ